MASKKATAQFNKEVGKVVTDLGGTVSSQREDGHTCWSLNTKAGNLNITVHAPEKTMLYSVFTCFDEPKKAKEVIGNYLPSRLNEHSGKFNFHMADKTDILTILKESLEFLIGK